MAFSANNDNFGFSSSIPPSMSSLLSSVSALRASQFPSLTNSPSSTTTTKAVTTTPAASQPSPDTSSTRRSSSKANTASGNSSLRASANSVGATATISSSSIISPTGSTLATSYTSEAASAANTSGSGAVVISESEQCNSISCSSSLKAAVAVPVALVGLGLIIALILLARRRRKREEDDDDSSSRDGRSSAANRWTRHLRVFSFDAELLMGTRSSNNSLRSGLASRESIRSHHQPSLRSLESPAPPYRDAISGQPMAERPSSVLTAPPAYVAPFSRDRPGSRLSVISRPSTVGTDPFADPDEPISPVRDGSSAAFHPGGGDDSHSLISTLRESEDGGSVREAQVATSVAGGGRQINDVRNPT